MITSLRSKDMLSAVKRRQRGFSLIELMIAMFVLTIGMLGGMIVLTVAIASNAQARFDTGAVALAQSTMDRIVVISQRASGTSANSSITDCNGNTYTVATAIGGAPTTTLTGVSNGTQVIDFTQAAVANYQMTYTLCAAGGSGYLGTPQTYDVRWNISAGPTTSTQLVLVAAKHTAESGNGNGLSQARFFSVPITLRALRGN